MLTPVGPKGRPAEHAPRGASLENGRYLAHHVANCVSCHTRMDLRTGELTGPLFGGGAEHPARGNDKTYSSPNLTPDPRWGWIEGWDADAFAARLTSGVGRDGSVMPWSAFKQLSREDAQGITCETDLETLDGPGTAAACVGPFARCPEYAAMYQ